MADSKSAARRGRRKAAKADPLPQKHCESCGNWMAGEDDHEDCVRCLGVDHAEDAFDRPERCSICADTPRGILSRRLKRVRDFFPLEARDRDRERADIRANERHEALSPSRYSESDYLDNPSFETAQRAVTAALADGAPAEVISDDEHSPPRQRREPGAWAREMDSQDPLPAAQAEAPAEDVESMEEDDDEGASSDTSGDSSSSAQSTSERRGGRFEEAPPPQEQPAAILPPAANVEMEVAVAPAVEPQAIAQAPQPLAKDDAPLVEIFKRSALRAGLVWPTEEAQDTEDDTMWDAMDEEEEPSRSTQLLPMVKGFDRILTASWQHPHSFTFPPGHKQSHDAAGMAKLGMAGMPHMHHRIAAHLLRQPVNAKKEPVFTNTVDKDNSKTNHSLYSSLATAAKALNAVSLLQGSATFILKAAGDQPTAENMAELRRIHKESLRLTKYVTERTGRAMACSAVLERARWLAYAPKTRERMSILDETLLQDKLFSGTLDAPSMSARNEEEKREGEALRAYLPTEYNKPAYSSTYKGREGRRSSRDSRPQFKSPPGRASSNSASRQRGPPPPPPRSDSVNRRKPSAPPAGQQQRRGYKSNRGSRGQGK